MDYPTIFGNFTNDILAGIILAIVFGVIYVVIKRLHR